MRAWPYLLGGAAVIGVIGYVVVRHSSSTPATSPTVNMLPPSSGLAPGTAIGPAIRHITTTTAKHVTVGPTATPPAPSFSPG